MFFTKSKGTIYSNTSYSGADIFASISIGGNGNFPGGSYVIGELQTLSYSLHMERGTVRACGNINAKDYTDGPRTIAGSLVFAVFDKHFVRNVINATGIDNLTTTILADELPPFDITVTYANEYGHRSVMRIYGIKLVNEGMVMSINDILTENTYQYVATNISPINTIGDMYEPENTDQEDEQNEEDEGVSYDDLVLKGDPFLDVYSLKDATENEEGIVYLNIINPLESNIVAVFQDEKEIKRYTVLPGDMPFSISLPPGIYTITMLDASDEKIGNPITIEVVATENAGLTAPIVQYVTQSIISGITTDKLCDKVICFNDEEKYEETIEDLGFAFSKLKPDTSYTLYALSKDGKQSANVTVTTNVNAQERFLEWKTFVLSNKNSMKKEYLDHFLESFDKILALAKNTSYAKSLTYYYYTLKQTYQKNSPQYIATDYLTKEANIYELKNLFSVFKYNMGTDDYYNNQIRISKAATHLYLTYNGKTTQININSLKNSGSYYLYTFPNECGIYTVKQTINNSIDQKADYYVVEDSTRTQQAEDNLDKQKDFAAILDRYYNENITTIGDKSKTDDSVVQGAFNQGVISAITSIVIKEQTKEYVIIEKAENIDKDCYLIFSTYKDLVQNSFVNKIPFSKDEKSVKVLFKTLISNENNTYFVYLEEDDSNIISKAIVLKTTDLSNLNDMQKELFLNSLDKKYVSSTIKAYIEEVMENDYINNNEILEDTKELILSLKPSTQRDRDLFNILNLIILNSTSKVFKMTVKDFTLISNKDNSITVKSLSSTDNKIIYGYYDNNFKFMRKETITFDKAISFIIMEGSYYICFTLIQAGNQSQIVLYNIKTKAYYY